MNNDLEIIAPDVDRPVLLLCDHAGYRVPGGAAALGIDGVQLRRHIGWDIGAADVTRGLARRLGAHAILSHASRLLLDPNRRPGIPSSIPAVSDGCVVPANQRLTRDEARLRFRTYFVPYHGAIARWVAKRRALGQVPALIAVHSFTPLMEGEDRPWHVGVLWRNDVRLAAPVLEGLHADPALIVGDNQPYSGLRDFGYTITFHAQRTRLPHVMFEIRQDLITTAKDADAWAERLAGLLSPLLDDEALYAFYDGDNKIAAREIVSWRRASQALPLA